MPYFSDEYDITEYEIKSVDYIKLYISIILLKSKRLEIHLILFYPLFASLISMKHFIILSIKRIIKKDYY